MGTIADKLSYLSDIKEAIRTAIINKGVDVPTSDTFMSYADKIGQISGDGGSDIYVAVITNRITSTSTMSATGTVN